MRIVSLLAYFSLYVYLYVCNTQFPSAFEVPLISMIITFPSLPQPWIFCESLEFIFHFLLFSSFYIMNAFFSFFCKSFGGCSRICSFPSWLGMSQVVAVSPGTSPAFGLWISSSHQVSWEVCSLLSMFCLVPTAIYILVLGHRFTEDLK